MGKRWLFLTLASKDQSLIEESIIMIAKPQYEVVTPW